MTKEYICECGKKFYKPQAYSGHRCRCKSNPNNSAVFVCQFCGAEIIGLHSFNKHVNYCVENPNHKTYLQNADKSQTMTASYTCSFCGKECIGILSLRGHERLCKANPNRSKNNVELGILKQSHWNKGLTKEDHPSIQAAADKMQGRHSTFAGKSHSADTKARMSKSHVELFHSDENRKGRGKAGWYDGIYMMSTYELAFYIYHRDKGDNIERCKKRFLYELDGKNHYYYPDFILNDTIVEIKGFETYLDKIKYQSVPELIVLRYVDIKHCIDYVKTTYEVENIQDLYES